MLLALLFLLAATTTNVSRGVSADDEPSMAALIVATITSIILTKYILDRDESRLSAPQRSRSWLPATRMSALTFAPFALIVHYARTRRTLVGTLFGVLMSIGVLVVTELVAQATEWLIHRGGIM